jgi:hypothetical protein
MHGIASAAAQAKSGESQTTDKAQIHKGNLTRTLIILKNSNELISGGCPDQAIDLMRRGRNANKYFILEQAARLAYGPNQDRGDAAFPLAGRDRA